MASINNGVDTSTLESLGLTRKESQRTPSNEMGQDDFMTLMLAQLKHQDPMSPMENNEFLAQIAQFNTVTGIQDLQKSFDDLVVSQQSNQALQASSLVGRAVLVPGESGQLPDGGMLEGFVDLPSSSPQVNVGIYDGSGQLVRTVQLGSQPAGYAKFSWDGLANDGTELPPGTYNIAAEARGEDGYVAADTLMAARVDSVSLGNDGSSPKLNLNGFGEIELSRVREVM